MNRLLYRIHIGGRVQGVGFRWNTARVARQLGISGFVKNLPDGGVYVEAEGEREILESFVEWCRTGPPFSFVESVEVSSSEPVGYREFVISH
ncbi:MAG TPA: acylphosphatase [Bacteroidales bacterium]|jgi:acylphosphatase|nr:acylphosphatase [Bacteroidales bacterium]